MIAIVIALIIILLLIAFYYYLDPTFDWVDTGDGKIKRIMWYTTMGGDRDWLFL